MERIFLQMPPRVPPWGKPCSTNWRGILSCFFGESANRFNRSAGGKKSEVGGIVDNKDFRLILERSLERSPSRLPPRRGGDRAVTALGEPVGAQDAEKCLHLLTP